MRSQLLTEGQLAAFQRDGFIIVPELLSAEEADLLRQVAKSDREISLDRQSRADGEGGSVDLVVRNDVASDSVYSAIVQAEPLVSAMEALLQDEVYHYHHKMILKDPHVGGAWTWHQDYGYWYSNGCLYPDMASCMIAVDDATVENGCLQVLRGSHHMGRIEHLQRGDQTGADIERVEAAVERLELVHVEIPSGAGVIFHANLLHRSDRNNSEYPRWAFICCYNTRHNNPYRESKHPRYTPLTKQSADRIAEVARRQLS